MKKVNYCYCWTICAFSFTSVASRLLYSWTFLTFMTKHLRYELDHMFHEALRLRRYMELLLLSNDFIVHFCEFFC